MTSTHDIQLLLESLKEFKASLDALEQTLSSALEDSQTTVEPHQD